MDNPNNVYSVPSSRAKDSQSTSKTNGSNSKRNSIQTKLPFTPQRIISHQSTSGTNGAGVGRESIQGESIKVLGHEAAHKKLG